MLWYLVFWMFWGWCWLLNFFGEMWMIFILNCGLVVVRVLWLLEFMLLCGW